MKINPELHPVMNNTKWEELRLSMYESDNSIKWRVKNIDGDISNWDAEWFYHFKLGGYETIEWLEIQVDDENVKTEVINKLKRIHVPGEIKGNSIFVYGYARDKFLNYI